MRERRMLTAVAALVLPLMLATPIGPARAAGKQDLVVLLSREFGHLDPVDLQASDQGILFHLIFSYLYRLNKDAARCRIWSSPSGSRRTT
jgi:MarR-like DNA-binding transcriptional regulator SgrR of sgrS sRNA